MPAASRWRPIVARLAACAPLLAAPALFGHAASDERVDAAMRSAESERAEDAALAREAVRNGNFVAVESLLDWIEARYHGRAIEVELEEEDEGDGEPPTYEIEWLTPQQHVVEFEFDARNGELLEVEGRGLEAARRP